MCDLLEITPSVVYIGYKKRSVCRVNANYIALNIGSVQISVGACYVAVCQSIYRCGGNNSRCVIVITDILFYSRIRGATGIYNLS